MKRISTLLLSAAMAFGAAGAADAAELKASGVFDFAFGGAKTEATKDNSGNEEYFRAEQRFRPQLKFIASESLQAVMQLEIGTTAFGRSSSYTVGVGTAKKTAGGGRIDERDNNIEVKRLYLDWIIPTTEVSVRMGKQDLALPSATGFGNPVFNSDVAGIVASSPINDMVSLTGFWVRPYDSDQNKNNGADEVDAFGFAVPVKGEGWSVSPWAMYASLGNTSEFTLATTDDNGRTGAYWLGLGADYQIMDGLKFSTDFMYGRTSTFDGTDAKAKGYFFDAALAYDIENVGTASLLGWYATGNDADDNDYGQIPVLGTNGGFHPTTFGAPGSAGIGQDGAIFNSGIGTWGLGVELADVTFVEDLSHTFRVAYIQGTNNREATNADSISKLAVNKETLFLTPHDAAWEFNFDSKYQIYENLAAFVELGYISLDIDDTNPVAKQHDADDLWKAQVLFQYKF